MIHLSSILAYLCINFTQISFHEFFSMYFTKHVQTHNYSTRNAQDYVINQTKKIAHSHENGSGSGFYVLWSNNPCSLHKICNRINFLLDLDKIYTDIYSFLYFWLQIHTTFAPKDLKTRKMACPQRYTWIFQRYISIKMQHLNAHSRIFPSKIHKN